MPNQSISRRGFIKTAGITLAAASVTCSGLGYAVTRAAQFTSPKFVYEKAHAMNKRILITYATRAGSTIEVASAIGETLSNRGFSVDVKPVKETPSLDGYQAIVMGSAIRMGGWLPEAVDFIKNNQQALNNLPVALFSVHILNLGDDEQSRASRAAYLNGAHSLIQPVEEIFFAGAINPTKLSFVDRLMVKMVKSPIGDLRDWDKIHAWANTATLSQER